jgi:Putative SAM-dependent methyltransferase
MLAIGTKKEHFMLVDFEGELRRLDQAGRKQFGADWIPSLKQRRVTLEAAYATLYQQDRDPISYASPSAQTAYVFAYAPARAEYARQYLHRHRTKLGQKLFDRKEVRVVSFGGGPASELVGLVRYLEGADEPVRHIRFTIYDKDGDWANVAKNIVNALKTDIEIEMCYKSVDAASRDLMAAIDLSETDMVIFSYIMSELARVGRSEQIATNFREVLGTMPLNSKILFIDNLHPIFIDFFRSCKLVKGLNQKNDDGDTVTCNFAAADGIFGELSDSLEWEPRTDLRSISKLIARTNI